MEKESEKCKAMDIQYKEEKEFRVQDIEELFLSVGWASGKFPNRITEGLKHSTQVISAWDGDKLIGLVRALDDGCTVAFIHYLLVRPEYQQYHIGTELMQRLLDHYKDCLYIKVMPSDIKANKFYKNLSFQQYDNYTALEITNLSKLKDF